MICNASSTFQRAMEMIYLDNVIVLRREGDESLDWLAQVFKCLHSYGLKLKLPECHLL